MSASDAHSPRDERGSRFARRVEDRDRVSVGGGPAGLTAAIVVGADGVGSRVRRAMGASIGDLRAHALEVDTEPLPGEAGDVLRFDASERPPS